MYKEFSACSLCPRKCSVDRNSGQKGVCGESGTVRIGRAALHYWEEPCISGEKGSGTVFFSGCPLKCVYCQNYALSNSQKGVSITESELADKFLELERQGALNINLVTAEHFAPAVKEAVLSAKNSGLKIPIILNSSGYVSEEALEILKDVIDIYLVDFKYIDENAAKKYSLAKDYPAVAKKALEKMVEMKGELHFDSDGILKSGVIVRHLCLPGRVSDSIRVIEYLYNTYGEKIRISIMSQFTPMPKCREFPEINCKLTEKEYDSIIDYCIELGIEDAYIQEGDSASESFIPEFL